MFLVSFVSYHSGNSSSRIVLKATIVGNISILWELSKFDPLQKPNPLTDYYTTIAYVHETNT